MSARKISTPKTSATKTNTLKTNRLTQGQGVTPLMHTHGASTERADIGPSSSSQKGKVQEKSQSREGGQASP